MPCYEFLCKECNTPFELRQSMSAYAAAETHQCPSCGSVNVVRRLSAVGVMTGSRCAGGSSQGACGSGFT